MCPGRVDLPAPALVHLVGETLPDTGQAEVAELDQVERVDRDLRVRETADDRLAERCRGVDRHHTDPVPPGLATGAEPVFDCSAVAAVDDAEDLPAAGVHDRGHPRLDPRPGAGIDIPVPAHPSVAVLIDPELGDVQSVDIGQCVDRHVDRLLGGPPGDPVAPRDLVDRLAKVDHRGQQGLP